MRASPILVLLAVLVACARHPVEREASTRCISPAPAGALRTDSAEAMAGVLRGRLAWDGLRRSTPVRVKLSRQGWTSTTDVQADTFQFNGVMPGYYELRTLTWGQHPRVDSVPVTSQGLAIEVPFAWTLQLDGCGGNTITVPGER